MLIMDISTVSSSSSCCYDNISRVLISAGAAHPDLRSAGSNAQSAHKNAAALSEDLIARQSVVQLQAPVRLQAVDISSTQQPTVMHGARNR